MGVGWILSAMGYGQSCEPGGGSPALFSFILLALVFSTLFCGCVTRETPVAAQPSTELDFPWQITGSHFIVFFYTGDEVDAGAILAILEHAGVPMYREYFGTGPTQIVVFIETSPEKYTRLSGYPEESWSVSPGAVSVNYGQIFINQPAGNLQACRIVPVLSGRP
jgi:hypothetical protein